MTASTTQETEDSLIEYTKTHLNDFSPANHLSKELLAYGEDLFSKFPTHLHLIRETWVRGSTGNYKQVLRTKLLALPTIGKNPIKIYFSIRYKSAVSIGEWVADEYDVVLSDDPFDMAANLQFGDLLKNMPLEDVKKELIRRVGKKFLSSFYELVQRRK